MFRKTIEKIINILNIDFAEYNGRWSEEDEGWNYVNYFENEYNGEIERIMFTETLGIILPMNEEPWSSIRDIFDIATD